MGAELSGEIIAGGGSVAAALLAFIGYLISQVKAERDERQKVTDKFFTYADKATDSVNANTTAMERMMGLVK